MKQLLFAASVSACALLLAQERVDEATAARLKSEEAEHSQLMRTLHMLTDRYGPRVTGTPNHEAAAKYLVDQFNKWGFKNAHLEPWDFGHPGWTNERAAGFLVSPVKQNLKFEVLAWTPSTDGTVTASTVQLVPPQGPEIPVDPQMAAAAAQFGGGGRGPQRGARQNRSHWQADRCARQLQPSGQAPSGRPGARPVRSQQSQRWSGRT